MAMIPCTTGTLALYAQEDGSILAKPVEAWSGEEPFTAFVAAPSSAHLVAAHSLPGYLRLEMAAMVLPPPREVRQPERVAPRPGRRPAQEGPREREGV
ncbi:hypothetical protein ACQEVF_25350 [Nonomuraea polychroma]|uniref:hypothetical protein n=1 Tax=Nonomuraea polychroma TaxID=46176 RepID=UPI003D8EAC2D